VRGSLGLRGNFGEPKDVPEKRGESVYCADAIGLNQEDRKRDVVYLG
jgi:hypothetical protein